MYEDRTTASLMAELAKDREGIRNVIEEHFPCAADRIELLTEIVRLRAKVEAAEAAMMQASPGFSYEEIARSAHKAYEASMSEYMPLMKFDDMPQPYKTAWEAAVRQVVDLMEAPSIIGYATLLLLLRRAL